VIQTLALRAMEALAGGMKPTFPSAVNGPVMTILGVLCVVWAVLAYRSERRYISKALRANGIVQSLRLDPQSRSNVYFPIVSFTTAAGNSVVIESKTSRTGGFRVGQSVSVLYNPDNPNDMQIDVWWSRWGMVILAAVLAAFFLGIGLNALTSY
jgi:hypothetical protein